jgi:hypothetical protein
VQAACIYTVQYLQTKELLAMESGEVEELEKEMHEGAEASLKHVSLIISVLAVLVAVVTVMGHRTHTEAVLVQADSSDHWNEYQARRLRIVEIQSENDLLTLEPVRDPAAAAAKIAENKKNLDKWSQEQPEVQQKAKDAESGVKVAEARAARFDLSEALLEIAVVLASITLLTRREMFALAAVALGVVGTLIGASAFLIK